MTILELHSDKIQIDPVTNCWLWIGAIDNKGYGHVRWRYFPIRVHRLSAHLSLGLDLTDKNIHALHKLECVNKNCCNPEHIYLGNNFDNQHDSVIAGTHSSPGKYKKICKNGHILEGDNVYIPADGRRRCVECRRINTLKSYHKHSQTRQKPKVKWST